ncbi:two-partner secretion domain-containing protein [Sphingomonas sp. PB4P5]|uniref:two-partner secretion domain-containing protein n=1 Tax=Parasphingomonas puruogangriensis TaxID=3096155 RepID=UPI002FCA2BE4
MLKSKHRRQIRRSLAITTALATSCLIVTAAGAQSLPATSDANPVAVTGGINPQISKSGSTLTVNLRATGTVIDWDGFNIPGGSTVQFNDSRPVVQGIGNIAVLNRDVSGTSSTISGNLSSEKNVAVWIYNSHGILIGGGASINTGSLVLTTLEPTNFLSGNGYRLSGADDLTAGITVQTGARISVEGGNRGLILVAPQINANGTFTAGNQDVAFVTATDVTLNYSTGSPLSVTLNKGTSVGGSSQIVRGTVSGSNVTFALASRASVTDALLSIGASVTTATSSERGIVLLAGRPSGTIDGITVGGTTAQTGGVVSLAASGTLTAAGNEADIIAAGSGAVTLARALNAGRDVRVTAGGLATVSGAVTAGQDYLVTGTGVSLGSAAETVTQQALRNVTATSNNGTLTGLGALTLIGDSNNNGNGALTLATTGTSGGNIAFGSATQLRGGEDGESDVRVRVRTAANSIALGDVTGSALLGSIGSAAYTNGLSISGVLTLGDVDVNSAITLRSATMTTGALRSDDAITLVANGTMRVDSIDADGGVSLTGTGATVIRRAVTARGNGDNILIQRAGAVSIGGNVSAGRDLTIGTGATPATSIAIEGTVSARNISLIASGAQTLRGDISARGALDVAAGTTLIISGQTRAAGDIALRAEGMRLTDVVSTGGALNAQAGAGAIIGTSSGGVRLGAFNSLTATGGGALTIAQAVSERGTVNLTGTGITAATLTAGGDVLVNGGQSIVAVSGAVSAGGAYRVTGGTVTLGNSGTVTQAASGLVAINAGVGGITGLGTLTLQSNKDGAGSESLTLAIVDTAPSGAIAFSGNSTLLGGTARQSDVLIRSGSADGSVLLGNVEARGLLGAVGTAAFSDGLVRNTALRVGNVDVTRALVLNGAGVTGGNLVSDGAVTLISNGALVARSIDAGGNATLGGSGATTISGLLQTRGTGRNVLINRDGALRIGSLQAGGAVAIGTSVAPASLDIGAASSGGAFTATTIGAQLWRGAITAGGAVTLSGDSLSTRDVRSTGGAISLTSMIGGLSAGVIDGAGLTTLTSAGTLGATSVRGGAGVRGTATGAVTIAGTIDGGTGGVVLTGPTLELGAVRSTAGAVTLTANSGVLSAGAIDGGGATTLTSAGALTATSVRGGGGVRATAAGNLAIGGLVDGGNGNVVITATGGSARLTGGVSARGDYRVTGQSVILGGTQTANGAVAIIATAGGLTGQSGLVLTANGDGAGSEAMTLETVGGDLVLAGNSVLNGGPAQQSNVVLRSGGGLTLGSVDARSLTINDGARLAGPLTTGNLSLARGLTLLGGSGGIHTGTITIGAGSLSIDAIDGVVKTSTIDVGGTVSLSGASIAFSDITGTAVTLQSIGAAATGITGDDITASGPVALTAVAGAGGVTAGTITTTGTAGAVTITSSDTVQLDRVTAGGTATITTLTNPGDILIANGLTAASTVRLTSTRDIRAPFVTSTNGSLVLLAPNGSLTGYAPGSTIALSTGSGLTLDVGQAVRLGALTGGAISLRADTIEIDSIDVGSNLVDLFADSGDLEINGGVRGGTVTLKSSGTTSIAGAIVARGALTLSGRRVDFGDLTGASVNVQSIGAGATGIRGGDITASGPVTLNAVEGGGGITTGVITTTGATGAVAINSVGTIRLGGVDASGSATITTSTNPADIVISGGLTAAGTVRLTSTRDVLAPFVTSTNGALIILAPNGSLTGYAPGSTIALTAGAGLTLDVGQAVRLGALTGGAISLRADSIEIESIDVGNSLVDLFADRGDLTIDGGVRGGVVTLASTGLTRIGGAIQANGALSVSGAQVDLRGVTAGGLATFKATGGSLGIGSLIANGGIDALATGDVSIVSLGVAAGSASIVSSGGDTELGAAVVSGNLAVRAKGSATLLDAVSTGGSYTVRGSSILLGGAGIVQRAGGQIAFTSTAGGISGGSGLSLVGNAAGATSAMLIDSAGAIALAGTTIDNGSGALGLRAGNGASVTVGAITAGAIGGIATAADGSTSATDTFQHDAAFTAGDITARDIAIVLSAGTLSTGDITASGVTRLATRDAIATGDVRAATIDVAAGAALAGGAYNASGTAQISGASVALDRLAAGAAGSIASRGSLAIDSVTGATLTISATGDITGRGTARTLLTTTGGDLMVDGGALVRLGDVGVAGAASISGTDIDIAGTLSAARAALIKARAALTIGDASAGGTLTLDAGGALSAQALRASGDALVTAVGNATVASIDSGGALTIKGNNVTLGSGRATGAASVDAVGLATLGQVVAGPTLTIRASDAALTGVQRAASVTFDNRTADTTALRLGDGTANDGFRLSDAEIKFVEADNLTFRQGNGAVEIGTVAFDADAGRRSVDIMGTGAIAVRGVVSGAGAGRRFRLGGDTTDGGMASEINVVATSDAGGRLLFDGADLELRGNRIAVGVAPGFIDALTGASFEQVVSGFVGNANSSLYNANIGGGFYDVAAQTTVSANSLTVRYGDYALFQNTGGGGQSSGIVLGSVGSPANPALTLLPPSAATNAFAAFGTINGIGGTAAALLGSGVVSLGQANLGTTRINGCLVGSGAGCLAAIVIQPTLQVFETTQQDVFGSVESLDVPFDPVVSGSNEELLTGLATMGPRASCEEGDTECANAEETPK